MSVKDKTIFVLEKCSVLSTGFVGSGISGGLGEE